MKDENIAAAMLEGAKGTGYVLLQDAVFPMAQTYIGEVHKRLGTLFKGPLSDGNYIHVEVTVEDSKAIIIEKVKKALKEKKNQ